MDGELRELLEKAKGRSEYIFAVVADIRGFSAFSQRHESPEVATYVKRVYIQLIDNYFPFATFYKATGDNHTIWGCEPAGDSAEDSRCVSQMRQRLC